MIMNLKEIEIIYNCQPTPGIILKADAPSFSIALVNHSFHHLVPMSSAYQPGETFFDAFTADHDCDMQMAAHIYEAFNFVLSEKKLYQIQDMNFHSSRGELQDLGEQHWRLDIYPLLDENQVVNYIAISYTDISIQVLAERSIDEFSLFNNLEHLEKEVLQLNSSKDVALTAVLSCYTKGIEALFPKMRCSIMQIKNNRMYNWSSPSLPKKFITAIDGIEIGISKGSCGTAAYLKKEVISNDIANDPRWANFHEFATAAGLKACWSYPIINTDRQVLATFGIYYLEIKNPDLGEQKIIERAAALLQVILENRQHQEVYRNLFQFSPQPTFVYDPVSLKFLDVNDAAVNDYGYSREEFLAMDLTDIRPEEDIKDFMHMIKNELQEGFYHTTPARHRKKSGEIMLVFTKGNSIPYNGKEARLVMAIDETARIKAEEALMTSERRFKTLIHDGADLIFILDTDNNYLYVSPNAERLLHIQPDSLLGKNVFDFIHPLDLPLFKTEFAKLNSLKSIDLTPFRYTNGNNEIRWAEMVVTDLRNEPGIEGILANARDITQRTNYIHAIEQHNLHLSEIKWSQAHLVRAPLARIMGIVELLKDTESEPDTFHTLMSYLHISARELDSIIQETIKSKIQSHN